MEKKSIELLKDYMNPPEVQIIGGGYVQLDKRWRAEGVCSPYARLYLIEDGEGILTENGQEKVLYPNYAYLVPTGTSFDYRCESTLTKLFIHINMMGDDGKDLLCGLSGIRRVTLEDGLVRGLVQLCERRNFSSSVLLKGEILCILGRLMEEYPADSLKQPVYSKPVRLAIDMIKENLSLGIKSEEIAKHLFMSGASLRRRFKEETGVTITQYIDDLIFFKARLLLVKSELSIREISDLFGFCDQFYFSRRFALRYGISPYKYRQAEKEKEKCIS